MNASLLLESNLAMAALQVALIVLVAAPLPRLLGIWSPRARLVFWRALLIACVLVPVFQPRIPDVSRAVDVAASREMTRVDGAGAVGAADGGEPADGAGAWLPPVTAASVIGLGISLRLAWLALGLLTLARLRSAAAPLWPRPRSVDQAVAATAADAEFLVSPHAVRPMTFGFLRPVVVVPSDFAGFTFEQQKAIACHELLHVRRLDWLRNAVDELVRTVAWFHPAAWWLTGQIQLSREQLVDQQVVRCMGGRRPYLDALLQLASSNRRGALLPASLFLGRAHLPQRVALLVKEVSMSRPRLVLSFAVMTLVLVACGRGVIDAFPLRGPAPGPALSDPQPVRPGDAVPQAAGRQPAAASELPRKIHDVRPVFPPDAQAGNASPALFEFTVDRAGRVTELRPLGASPAAVNEAVEDAVMQWRYTPPARAPFRVLVGFNPAAGNEDPRDQPPVLIGGEIKAPRKLADHRPVYPAEAMEALDQGVVIIEARIDSEGAVSEALILRSIPSLDRSALEAVLRWRYEPRGVPMSMTVTVNYTLDQGHRSLGAGAAAGAAGGDDVPRADGYLRVGKEIKPPTKVVDVRPVYPEDARAAGVHGVVIIEAKIGPDGRVQDARVLRSIPMLDEAALEAVRQWEFTPTLRNGTPVGVVMTVTVNFTLQ